MTKSHTRLLNQVDQCCSLFKLQQYFLLSHFALILIIISSPDCLRWLDCVLNSTYHCKWRRVWKLHEILAYVFLSQECIFFECFSLTHQSNVVFQWLDHFIESIKWLLLLNDWVLQWILFKLKLMWTDSLLQFLRIDFATSFPSYCVLCCFLD